MGITGDGRLDSTNTEAELIILQNDDPIAFAVGFVTADEGEMLAVRVERGGQAVDTATVTFILSLQTAMDEDVNLTSANEVTFTSGQNETVILLSITDDDLPELAEQFILELTNVTTGKLSSLSTQSYNIYTNNIGDAVIVNPSSITIEITANDDPYGVFLFNVTSLETTEESGMIELR